VKEITDATIRQIARNLREFGYDNLTDEEVRTQVGKIAAGEPTTNIIGMFARDMLVENGYLAEEP